MDAVVKAVKAQNGDKTVIYIIVDGQVVETLGGKRAERAEAILITHFSRGTEYGCRGSLQSAESEGRLIASGKRQVPGMRRGIFFDAVPTQVLAVETVGA